MSLNKIFFILFIFVLLMPADGNALFGIEARREQKQMLSEARSAFDIANYPLAIDISEEFLLKNANAPKRRLKRAYLMLGSSYKALGEYDKALLKYNEAIEFFPKDIELNLALGDIYMLGGLTDKAIEVYNTVLLFDKDNMPARLALAKAYLNEGFFARSSKYYKEYIESEDIKDGKIYYEYALSRYMANDYDKALELAIKSSDLEILPDTTFLLAKIYKVKGDTKKAIETIELASEQDRTREDIFLTRALWLAYDNAYNMQALEMVGGYLEDNPDDKLAMFVKFLALYRQGKTQEAHTYLKAITRTEGDGFINKLAERLLDKKP